MLGDFEKRRPSLAVYIQPRQSTCMILSEFAWPGLPEGGVYDVRVMARVYAGVSARHARLFAVAAILRWWDHGYPCYPMHGHPPHG